MPAVFKNKFQDQIGQWIYTQDDQQKNNGYKIIEIIKKKWRPHSCYYHFREGGHIEAVKLHLDNPLFLKADLQKFFYHVTKGKIIRCLVKVGINYKKAQDIANMSTVRNPAIGKNYILPFGFVQSPFLATLVLQKSALGKVFKKIKNQFKIQLSIYMDDILLSSESEDELLKAKLRIVSAAKEAGFEINLEKSTNALKEIQIFNIDIAKHSMKITDERMKDFMEKINNGASGYAVQGIIGYVNTVNAEQAKKII